MNVEQALQHYGDFRAGRQIPWKLRPYLEMLDEGDHVEGYLIGALGRRAEYRALKAFTNGAPLTELGPGVTAVIENFIDAMMDRFLEAVRYCPFCDAARPGSERGGVPYPLSSRACPHRELELLEDEDD